MSLLFKMLATSSSAKSLFTETFTANATWVAPAGVSVLQSAIGHGADGTPGSSTPASRTVVTISYHTSGSAGGGSIQWESVQGLAEAVEAEVNANGNAAFDTYTIQVYPDESNTMVVGGGSIAGAILGSASTVTTGAWQESGHISGSGTSRVSYLTGTPGVAGADATGFGKTFPGGAPNTAAPTTSFFGVAVTPGNSYAVVAPAGGSITITYLK